MDSYLVTGGAGFIGSHIVETPRPPGGPGPGPGQFPDREAGEPRPVPGRDRAHRRRRPRPRRPAGRPPRASIPSSTRPPSPRSRVSMEDPILADAINVAGTLNMLVAARDAGAQSFVLASSSAVYGDAPGLPQREGKEGAPLSPYAAGKLAGENYCRIFSSLYGMRTACPEVFQRLRAPAGPGVSHTPRSFPASSPSMLRGRAPRHPRGRGADPAISSTSEDVAEANLLAAAAPGLRRRGPEHRQRRGHDGERPGRQDHRRRSGRASRRSTRPRAAGDIRHSAADISQGRGRARLPAGRPVRGRAGAHHSLVSGEERRMKIAVIGTGYVGLVTAAGLAEFGHTVIGTDKDAAKIELISRGTSPIYEPGLDDLLKRTLASGNLSFSADVDAAIREAGRHLRLRRDAPGRGRPRRHVPDRRRRPARSPGTSTATRSSSRRARSRSRPRNGSSGSSASTARATRPSTSPPTPSSCGRGRRSRTSSSRTGSSSASRATGPGTSWSGSTRSSGTGSSSPASTPPSSSSTPRTRSSPSRSPTST